MSNTWVVASGFGEIDLAAIFLRLGVALIGPGDRGDFFDRRQVYESELEPQEWRIVREFAEDLAVGDRLVLRKKAGRNVDHLLAVGVVVGPYRHEPIFQEVDVGGWDMQHCRRVRWKKLTTPHEIGMPPNRFSRLTSSQIIAEVDQLFAQCGQRP